MTEQKQPVTPPIELVESWITESKGKFDWIAVKAARWGFNHAINSTNQMSNFVMTNHHIVVTSQEQEAIVNALAFFDWMFYNNAEETFTMKDWKEVAKEYPKELMDNLATKIATSN